MFDTLIKTLKEPPFTGCGVLWGPNNDRRTAWAQFADDAAVISESKKETQHLIYLFQRWTSWADLLIRPDKCISYGASKVNGVYGQTQPTFHVNGVPIAPVPMGGALIYLGHRFTFARSGIINEELIESMHTAIDIVNSLHITPLAKIHGLNIQLHAKLAYAMGQYKIGSTWIKQNMDNVIKETVRRWLSLPPCATLLHITLPLSKLGLALTLPSLIYEEMQLGTRLTLAKSQDKNIVELFHSSHSPTLDGYINPAVSKDKAKKNMRRDYMNGVQQDLALLRDQNVIIHFLCENVPKSELKQWSQHIATMPPNIASFARKAVIRCLPTNANLLRWKKAASGDCPNCGQIETDRHILNNCSSAAATGRYTWRHNAILLELVQYITPRLSTDQTLYGDLPGLLNPSEIFLSHRPDIIILCDGVAHVLELTCCHELNVIKSKQFKRDKYTNLQPIDPSMVKNVSLFTLEITSLGITMLNDLNAFFCSINIDKLPLSTTRRLGEMALRCSYFLFCSRHRVWQSNSNPPSF